jgi:CRISPR-associated protein Cst2
MRSTQNPHLVDLVGAVTISRDVVPAPAISPLKPKFVDEIEQTANALNLLRSDAVEVKRFEGVGEFANVMAELVQNSTPMALTVA